MTDDVLGFACTCGQLRGEITDISPSAYTNIVCHCEDCRSAYTHLGLADPEKVGILQTTQDRIHITQGGEFLRVFRLSAKGALRWFATCCDTPLFYTPLKPRMVHVGINTDRLDTPDAVGAVMAEGFIPAPGGKQRHKGLGRMAGRMVTRMAAKNLSGEWRNTPFFDDTNAPTVPPQVLTREERAAALMGLNRA
ncbi:GFA family protein [Jannaschia sp. M317]|uniref:GFA family protein n=1 Tax=Jannaschia sp. M317 TaxID=2867011 RepID=UPI0021A806F8|nr:GFA family protein [Jannaschia sp. M317]UWQ17287.1 GFA family protein [Jannaschia sp. M317]